MHAREIGSRNNKNLNTEAEFGQASTAPTALKELKPIVTYLAKMQRQALEANEPTLTRPGECASARGRTQAVQTHQAQKLLQRHDAHAQPRILFRYEGGLLPLGETLEELHDEVPRSQERRDAATDHDAKPRFGQEHYGLGVRRRGVRQAHG